jgi:signal transduction histidine kinase
MSDKRKGSLRLRITAGATTIVLFALLVTALAVSGLLRGSLDANTEELLVTRVSAVAEVAATRRLGAVLESTGREVGQVQVINADGNIVSRTSGLADTTRFDVIESPPVGQWASATVDGDLIDNEPSDEYRLVALTITTPTGPVTIYAITALDIAAEAQNYLQVRLLIALSGVGLLTGAVVYWVVGRSLRPVEEMRQQVERISADDRRARVSPPERDDELSRLGGTLNSLLGRLEEASDQQQLFAANASHELRSPLSAIRTDLEVGLAYPERTDWERTATDALIEIERLEQLTRSLRAFTTLGRMGDGTASCDLVAIVRSEIRRRANDMVLLMCDQEYAHIPIDQDSGVQVVRNLLNNAERHAESSVTVSIDRVGETIELRVDNDGSPIATEDRERVFQPFLRLDEARSLEAGGSGLGLAIVRTIVTSAGGEIHVDDHHGPTRFVTTFPTVR